MQYYTILFDTIKISYFEMGTKLIEETENTYLLRPQAKMHLPC